MIKLPEEYLLRMKRLLNSDYPAYLAAMEEGPKRSLRVNTLRLTTEELLKQLKGLVPNGICDEGFLVPENFSAGQNLLHAAGAFYMQEASAQFPATLAKLESDSVVLDLCAAPGGKTGQLASKLKGGVLIANEYVPKRAKTLLANVERLGIENAVITNMDAPSLCKKLEGLCDLVLVDAPCAGEGMFRKEPNAILDWSQRAVLACAARQRELLKSAAHATGSGGTLIYSTCSFSEEENEGVIENFLRENDDFSLLFSKRLYPHTCAGEGQFAAVLKRRGERRRLRFEAAHELSLPDGRRFLLPPLPFSLSGLRLVRAGLLLGELKGKTFVPSHASAMAVNSPIEDELALDKPAALRYMHGETLPPVPTRGYVRLSYKSLPLGLGKATSEGVKCLLPKAMRFVH
ncbi:MAG: RsmF rRNA methyltransferase first C-terminal domain-containing protein [Clostridia bacterium]|nr:RsmF rRNA methyltransferase first C-terminal domain-containing protein [Clostridia bacterium]